MMRLQKYLALCGVASRRNAEKIISDKKYVLHIRPRGEEKEEKIKEFWEYYESTQGSITIADPIVLD